MVVLLPPSGILLGGGHMEIIVSKALTHWSFDTKQKKFKGEKKEEFT